MTQVLRHGAWRRQLIVALALTALAPAAIMAVVPVNQPPPVLSPVTINNSAGDQSDPHVSGDWAAYTDNISIRYYNFATGVDAQIPMGNSVRDTLSDVSSGKIVFSRTIVGVKTAVMVFDAVAGTVPTEIDPAGAVTRLGSAIGGNTVAYVDFGLHANGELIVHDLTASTSQRITNDTAFDGNPSVSANGSVVTWEHCAISLANCDIWQALRTGSIWTVSVVNNSLNPEGNPDTNGTLVVYDSQRGGNSDIFWRPVAGGAEVQLQLVGLERNPNIAGGFVAFESQATALSATDLFVYDTVDNRLFQITNTPLINEQLNDITVLADGRIRIVWASDEDGFDDRNVKGATFQNVAPTLSYSADAGYITDGVDPNSGSRPTLYTYKVVYADFEDSGPAYLHICIDGICSQMSRDPDPDAAESLRDGIYTDGEQYSHAVNLSSGTHTYYFEASDGTATVRLPRSGVSSGPAVSDLTITTSSLPSASVGISYTATFAASGGTAPYTWQTVGGLPPGIALVDAAAGTISGTPSAAGNYGFSISVSDAVGNYDSKSFLIPVAADVTPPVLAVPTEKTVNATDRFGAVVGFTVTATDAIDPQPMVSCVPPKGSTFAIGSTAVTCTATDASGNSSTATFYVIVKGASSQIADLTALVVSFNLKAGIENSLDAKLQNAEAALSAAGAGDTASACNKLAAFINEVQAQSGKAITTDQASQLIALANQIKTVLGCP